MKGFYSQIEEATRNNSAFRRVLYTGHHTQLVLMSLKPGEEIGEEVHTDTDQFFRFESGVASVVIDGIESEVKAGDVVIIPAGAKHNVVNTSTTASLKLYTLYSPPHHQEGLVKATKEQAEREGVDFDGTTTE